jgi:hypothetical protein
MRMTRTVLVGAAALACLAAAPQTQRSAAPGLQVDPLWPKPLPNHWLYGSITGVAVDARDHIWVVHRGGDSLNARTEMSAATTPPTAETCCVPAPQVLEFDAAGTLVGHWGGPGAGYDWPASPGAMAIDAKGNVWITAAGVDPAPPGGRGGGRGAATTPAPPPRPVDGHVLKFSRAGKFLLQIGKAGSPGAPDSKTALNRPGALAFDAAANEVYVADSGNRRMVVFDADSGGYKRHWGAYGAAPDAAAPGDYRHGDPPAKQFRTLSCVEISRDGLVYVCDRGHNRIQVFNKDGTWVKEFFVERNTRSGGTPAEIAFSNDRAQTFVYVADGPNGAVQVLTRADGKPIGSFGRMGAMAGEFRSLHNIASDSKGNVYTTEAGYGRRLQKFVRD